MANSPGWNYNQWARIYREFEADFVDLPRRLFFEIARRQVGGPVGRLLDIGCGDGKGLEYLSAILPETELVGFDPDPAAAKLARMRLRDRARVVVGSAEDFGENLGRFDMIVSYMNLRLWADLPRGLKRVQDALTPDGLAYIVDLRRDIPAWLREMSLTSLPEDRFREVAAAQIDAGLTLDELRGQLEAAGIGSYRLLPELPFGACRGAAAGRSGLGAGKVAEIRSRMARSGQAASLGRVHMHLFMYTED